MLSLLNNIPVVTRNILLINVLLYIISQWFLHTGGINLFDLFSSHYIGTPNFQPFQIVTHLFMHSQTDFSHLFFNMFALFIFGSFLESRFGHKRFFIFYFLCGIGAFAIENIYFGIEIYQLKNYLVSHGQDLQGLNDVIVNFSEYYRPDGSPTPEAIEIVQSYEAVNYIKFGLYSGLGASGALFGVLGAFMILFPNTELMILFIPFPIKAKYLIGFYLAYELYRMFNPSTHDNVNHLAHIAGATIGIAYVLINRRIDRQNFY